MTTDAEMTQRPSRKGKEREHTTIDIADRIVALQRRQAASQKPRERSERPERPARNMLVVQRAASPPARRQPSPPAPVPRLVLTRGDAAESDEFSRRRRTPNTSPKANNINAHPSKKLYDPNIDSIPTRLTAEPEAMSDNGSSSYAPRGAGTGHGREPVSGQPRLFDYRKDDPVRFHALGRPQPNGVRPLPTPKSSGEYVSASSTSSYAHSVTSSNFTLSSTTDGSSASSALFESQARESNDSDGIRAYSARLKKMYRNISSLEAKILAEDNSEAAREETPRVTLKRPNEATRQDGDEAEKERWSKFVTDRKQLADSMVELMSVTLTPQVPASLRNITTKYNIIVRLWTHAFSKPAETFIRASFSSAIALEYLQEFMFSAYTFYAGLQEDHKFDNFKIDWYEALGNLARYRMAIAAMTAPPTTVTGGSFASVSERGLESLEASEASAARIDDSPGPSVGVAAARALELEPEKERWRKIAQDWYAKGLALQPGAGKLHRYLGLLSRDAEGEELRSAYHFLKSMSAAHPAPTREAALPLWSIEAQARRRLPDASTNDLFVFMHGMLFTHIQVDEFLPTLARFLERLELEDVQERDWIMMAIINITALLEYGKEDGVLRRTGGVASNPSTTKEMAAQALANAKVNHMVKKMDEIDVDDATDKARDHEMDTDVKSKGILNVSPILVEASSYQPTEDSEYPLTFKYGLQLTFSMLAHCLRRPTRKPTPFSRTTLNPYITALLTFLVTVMKHKAIKDILERYMPWPELVAFFSFIPKEPLNKSEGGLRLTAGCEPLPEDRGMRGMEWVGRRVYDRGFWKDVQDGGHPELDMLEASERLESSDGIIEDEDDENEHQPGRKKRVDIPRQRWTRAARAALLMVSCVPGLHRDAATGKWKIEGALAQKVDAWKDEERREREAEQRRHTRRKWSEDAMDIDEADEDESDVLSDSDDEDSDDTEEVRTLKARRRELRRLLQREKSGLSASPVTRSRPRRPQRNAPESRPPLRMVPGFTILIVDTNVLLSSLPDFSALVESLQWTVVVPLAVVTELDGIASNSSVLGDVATEAVKYITSHVRSHSLSLKVQTSKGNYLSNLSIRSEQIDFNNESWERSMDDLILRATMWQDDHWVDRSALLKAESQDTTAAAKVVLVTFDRNLRLKARARDLDAADEKAIATIFRPRT